MNRRQFLKRSALLAGLAFVAPSKAIETILPKPETIDEINKILLQRLSDWMAEQMDKSLFKAISVCDHIPDAT